MKIALACSKNWYFYMATNLYALLKNNNVEKIYLFIEDDEIPYLKDKRIEFININKFDFIKTTSQNYQTHYTKLTFARCYFTKVLKEDKILYLDADTLVVDNIEELWNIDLKDNVLAAIHEPGRWNRHLDTYGLDDTYINTGVLLMDLKKMREERLDDAILWLINNRYLQFPDQDAINLVCRNRIVYLDKIYNSTETIGIVDNAKIIHYIRGNKGWIKGSPRSDIWFKHQKEMLGGTKMENYKVKALINFTDYLGKETVSENPHFDRVVGDEWTCSKERYEYLAEHNAVEIVEVEKVELPEIKEEKPVVKKKRTTKKK